MISKLMGYFFNTEEGYWDIPLWIPLLIRRFIIGFEKWDDAEIERKCKIIFNKRYGEEMFQGDWKLVASEAFFFSYNTGTSVVRALQLWAQAAPEPDWMD